MSYALEIYINVVISAAAFLGDAVKSSITFSNVIPKSWKVNEPITDEEKSLQLLARQQ